MLRLQTIRVRIIQQVDVVIEYLRLIGPLLFCKFSLRFHHFFSPRIVVLDGVILILKLLDSLEGVLVLHLDRFEGESFWCLDSGRLISLIIKEVMIIELLASFFVYVIKLQLIIILYHSIQVKDLLLPKYQILAELLHQLNGVITKDPCHQLVPDFAASPNMFKDDWVLQLVSS